MIIFPAIDLKDGQCVRLYKGLMEQATIFNHDPVSQAKQFETDGFKWLHMVDLNGAFEGKPVNHEAVKSVLESVKLPVQLGGGIRDLKTIEMWLELGITRVILGTIALQNPELVKQACQLFPGQIIVGIDAKNGMVAVQGWAEVSQVSVLEMAKQFEDCGVSGIIYTNIEHDGTLQGPDIQGTQALAQHVSIDIIASGGVSQVNDLHQIQALEVDGVVGVIVGRAIYDQKIKVADLKPWGIGKC